MDWVLAAIAVAVLVVSIVRFRPPTKPPHVEPRRRPERRR